MRYTWQLPTQIDDPYLQDELIKGWDTQDLAEIWLRAAYEDLREEGVTEVTLTCDETPIYTMSLDAE
ncbi:MAG: hypothetical protein LBG99_04465 [Propionibacteriaceae bacterium]|jgi:hypothetical protein|nr:hypothetical protein [Propionibacteriaceae bacterium]